jgi:hypothetical protein
MEITSKVLCLNLASLGWVYTMIDGCHDHDNLTVLSLQSVTLMNIWDMGLFRDPCSLEDI